MQKFQIRDLLGMGQSIPLTAPLAGWLMASTDWPASDWIGQMPDPGLVIDPVDHVLKAPCDGVVTQVHCAPPGLTMTLANGAELRLLIGAASDRLVGDGFVSHIAAGQWVWAGDPLISFDLSALTRMAKTRLVSVIVQGGAFRMSPPAVARPVAFGEPLARVRPNRALRAECLPCYAPR